MILTGVLVNTLAVLAAGLLGSLCRKGVPESLRAVVMSGLGLCILYMGITGAVQNCDPLVIALSLIIGVTAGELLEIDRRLHQLGQLLQRALVGDGSGSTFAEGFASCTIFVCVGAMAIVGAIESGMRQEFGTYYAKSLLDAVLVFMLAASLGPGCAFSALPTFVYEGGLTLCAGYIARFLSDTVITHMSCVGGVLIIAIGLNTLNITKLKIGSFLPAAFLPIVLCPLLALL